MFELAASLGHSRACYRCLTSLAPVTDRFQWFVSLGEMPCKYVRLRRHSLWKFTLQRFSDATVEDTLVLLEQACIDGVLHQYVLKGVNGVGAVFLFVHEFRLNKLLQPWL